MRPDLSLWQVATLYQQFEHFCMWGGIATGKTFTGSHFAIDNIEKGRGLTGMIGANTYDQLSQATMRELLYWLDEYRYDYVIDSRPPASWGARREFKTYKNVMVVRPKTWKGTVPIFTRVMASPNPLRGIEFSWYWLDETRDTPKDTHDVVLSRMRESKTYRRGLITSTTAGEDWAYERFLKNLRRGQRLYGSMHVRTEEAVKAGILAQAFYDALRASYSPLMAQQELDAQHVNVRGGRAYYASGPHNATSIAPWGDRYPSKDRPLIIGCDFNFSPAPMVWMVGQLGPNLHGPKGEYFGNKIHWFRELSGREVSTPEMAQRLVGQFGTDFFYEVYGDMSGNIGTSSNAGKTDFDQIGQVLNDAECMYSISVEQMDEKESRQNPRVRSRVENMNRMFKNSVGEVSQTYDPVGCPLFDGDCRMVGWKPHTLSGRGKLDDGGDKMRTHASDGAGYAVYKKFPPLGRGNLIGSVPSHQMNDMRNQFG